MKAHMTQPNKSFPSRCPHSFQVTKTAYTERTTTGQNRTHTDRTRKRYSISESIRRNALIKRFSVPYWTHSKPSDTAMAPEAALQTDPISPQSFGQEDLMGNTGAGHDPQMIGGGKAIPTSTTDQSDQEQPRRNRPSDSTTDNDNAHSGDNELQFNRRYSLGGVEPSMYRPASMTELPRISENSEGRSSTSSLHGSTSLSRWLHTRRSASNRKETTPPIGESESI